ncbi:MAG: M67 family metallopeptidase [Gammaproteobacteria bacterium]
MQLRLSNAIATALLKQARLSPRHEVCGLLGGRNTTAEHYYPVANIAGKPALEYLMDPQQQIDAMRHMREREEDLLGIFHSHPDSPAQPSDTDLARAAYPDTIYIIAGPVGDDMTLNAFYYNGQGFAPIEMEITNDK